MKPKILLLALFLPIAGTGVAHAQLFRPTQVGDAAVGTRLNAPVTGAVLGAVAGAAIGNNNGRNGVAGAVIGALAGYGLGSAVQQPPPARTVTYDEYPSTVPAIEDARTVPDAPTVGQEPPRVVYVEQPAPQVVYVERPAPVHVVRVVQSPRVVYVPAPEYCGPRPIIVSRPGYRSGYGRRDASDCGRVYVTPRRHGRW